MSGYTNIVNYASSDPVAVCEAARSLPNPPTGDGADVSGWTLAGYGGPAEFELTILAGATVELAAGAMLVAEEVHDTFPEESAAVTATNATETINYTGHGFQTGDGPVRISGTPPTGLSITTEYWVIRTGANTLQLATSRANALSSTEVTFSTDGANVVLHWVTGVKSLTRAVTAVDSSAGVETLSFAAAHGLTTAQRVQVSNSGGALPANLTADTDYYVIVVDSDSIALATSAGNAQAGTRIDLGDNGTGTQTVIYNEYGPTSATAYSMFHVLNGGLAVDLTADIGYRERVSHRPGVVAYHLVATLDVFAPVTAYVRPILYQP